MSEVKRIGQADCNRDRCFETELAQAILQVTLPLQSVKRKREMSSLWDLMYDQVLVDHQKEDGT
jgi:hypothetical protein